MELTSDLVVHGGGGTRNHHGGGVLDLHLVQEHVSVLGDLDLAGAAHQHLKGTAGPQVGLQHALQTSRRGDVDLQALGGRHDLGVGVY